MGYSLADAAGYWSSFSKASTIWPTPLGSPNVSSQTAWSIYRATFGRTAGHD